MQPSFSDEKATTGAVVTQVLLAAASETTVHGLSRLAGQRPLYVKLCWLLAFLTLLGIFLYSMHGFTVRYIQGETSTSYEAETANFEFPDVYFCNGVQVSGTYSVTLATSVVNEINSRINATFANFDAALQQMINSSPSNFTSKQIDLMRLYRLKSGIQSMPYKLLVDRLAHKEQQMVMKNDSKSGVTLTPFYHPNHLKCLKVELTEQRRTQLSKVNSEITFQFLLDPHFTDFDPFLNVSAYDQVNEVTVPLYNNLKTYVYDWDLDMPYEIDRPMGMRLYLAPRGEYPTRFVTNFLLAPGKSYTIGLTMQNILKDAETFKDKCLTSAPQVQFLNPYDGSAYPFNYSNSFCYFSEFASQLAQNGCSPYVNPLPWQHRDLRFCLNITGLNESAAIQSNLMQAFTSDTAVLNDFQLMCQSRQLCLTREYSTSTSSANWPNENGQIRVILDLMGATMAATPGVSRPAWEAAYALVNDYIFKQYRIDLAENIAIKFFSRSGLKVTLMAQESKSSQILLSSGYSLPTYIADMGGTAGIYLGCSLLSLCELIELVYNLIVRTRRKSSSPSVVQVHPVSASDSSSVSSRCSVIELAAKTG